MPKTREPRVPKKERGGNPRTAPLDWDTARVFLEVARQKSFRAAAGALGDSVNALRRHVERLERSLDTRLLTRQIETLSGLLPLCAWCKKVRNDRNYWESIETYIAQRSHATFSHGICPDCRRDFMQADIENLKGLNQPDAAVTGEPSS